ncbi:hypothetical protein FRB91_010634 [Serendipita sp. 411]|nr:hypothetical protein FRC18_011281 [Serendipita sp. 400]KAG8848630.1 hypothetical protein FRB91_010634 [Serendipita sp. 411]
MQHNIRHIRTIGLQTRRLFPIKRPKSTYVQASNPPDLAKSIPDERIRPVDHGVPPGPFPSSAMYKNYPEADQNVVEQMEDAKSRPSSSASTPAHPGTIQQGLGKAGEVEKIEDGVGSSSAVRFRSAPGEMSEGSDGGLGLMKKKENKT